MGCTTTENTQIENSLTVHDKKVLNKKQKGTPSQEAAQAQRTSAVMQLQTMFTSATLKDFKISLSVISPDTDASGSCVRLQDTGQVRSSSRQVSKIELTGSPCAS